MQMLLPAKKLHHCRQSAWIRGGECVNICMYIYIYMFVCMFVSILYIYIYICIYTYK